MEGSCIEPPPLPARTRPDAIGIEASAPSLSASTGLIAGYFAMQIAVGIVVALVIVVVALVSHDESGADAAVQATLTSPQTLALLAIASIGLAAPVTTWWVHRQWQPLWSLADPPGFGFRLPDHAWSFVIAILATFIITYAGSSLTGWLAQGQSVTQDVQQIGASTSASLRVPLALLVVVVAPFVEELLFRGVLLSALLRRLHVGWAVAISSLLFALIHLPGLNFQWYGLAELFLLALVLAALRLGSRSIWPAVLAHALHNGLAITGWFAVINLAS